MTTDQGFTDEELTAFLDGEAEADLVARIETGMSDALEARLSNLEQGRAQALAGFEAVLQAAPEAPAFRSPPRAAPAVWRAAGLGLAAGIVLAIGVGQAVFLRDGGVEPWHREVAAYHALYVTETLATGPQDPDVQAAKLTALSDLVGGDLSAAAVSEDMEFRRAQQLGFEGAPLIQIAYLAAGQVPVALCVLRAEGRAQDIRLDTIQGMSAASWSDGELRFLLIGGTDQAATERRAKDFAQRLKQG